MHAYGSAPALLTNQVCWVDEDLDRASASDQVRRYGAYLRLHAEWFRPLWDESRAAGGITLDPVEFAAAAFRVATSPIMSPGYVRWHSRVVGYAVGFGEDPDPTRLVCSVTLATAPPVRLGSRWWGWTRGRFAGEVRWVEPDSARHAALAQLLLRWPLPVARLPLPKPPGTLGQPNLADAKAAVASVVAELNATAGPVLAALEGGAS